MIYTPRTYQQAAVDAACAYLQDPKLRGRHGIVVAPTGCHAAGTQILMFDGSVKPVEAVSVGDDLMGPDNRPRRVLSLCRGISSMYRITPKRGGTPFVVNDDHVLSLASTSEGQRSDNPTWTRLAKGGRMHVSVRDYLTRSRGWRHLWKLHRAGELAFTNRGDLPLPPWILGLILGDGSVKHGGASICTADREIVKEVEGFARGWWLRVRVKQKPNNRAVDLCFTKRVPTKDRRYPNLVVAALRQLGVAGCGASDKFIPEVYKTAAPKSRLELLAGLIDSDGSHNGVGGFDFCVKSPHLAADVAFVARSLGLVASERVRTLSNGAKYYRVQISGSTHRVPCRVRRKRAPVRRQKKDWLVTGFSVEPVGIGDYFGFTLNDDHLYLTADFTVHHNSGKSLVIAGIATQLDAPCIVFQPSKEILEQNAEKLAGYGYRPAVFSASLGRREVGQITLATIGSVMRYPKAFKDVRYVLIDEAHVTNARGGMYDEFLESLPDARILGLTATPFRLASNSFGSQLRFLTRTRPRVFRDLVHVTQIQDLVRDGYWAPLRYLDQPAVDRARLKLNATGADYTDASVQAHLLEVGFVGKLQQAVEQQLDEGRRNVLVFTRFVHESERLAKAVPGTAVVTAETPAAERARILTDYRRGKIRVVTNVGVVALGFDYPELECVVLGRPSISLALYYQQVGRCVRPHRSKPYAQVVDLVGLTHLFGRVENLELRQVGAGADQWAMCSGSRQLTNVNFAERDDVGREAIAKANGRRKFWATRRRA